MTIDKAKLKALYSYDSRSGIFTRKVVTNNNVRLEDPVGCLRPDGYLCASIGGRLYQLHRLAWLYEYDVWPSGQIDHINGNRADNRISNLRDVPHIENGRNQKLCSTNKSGVNGVHWFASRSLWRAAITVNGKSYHLGYFRTLSEAAKSRGVAEKVYGFHQNHGRTEVSMSKDSTQ